MKLSILMLTSLLSCSIFAKSPLIVFSDLFNEADCVDEASIQFTEMSPQSFLFKTYYEAKKNQGEHFYKSISYTRNTQNEYFGYIIEALENGIEGYCMKPTKAVAALNYLVESFDKVEGIVIKEDDTGDDDSTTDFTIVMKDGSYTSIYFGN